MRNAIIALLACYATTVGADEATTHHEQLRDGHMDLLVLYEADEGLHMAIAAEEHHHEEEEEHDEHSEEEEHDHEHEELDHVEIVGGPLASSVTPGGSAWEFLGEADRFFYVLPQNQVSGLPFIGLNTEELDSELFTGDPTMTLLSVDGPGDFYLYQVDAFGQPVISMNSADSGEDSVVLPLGAHVHMNWGFSEPGEYALTFEISASMTEGTALVSEPQVVHFHIVGQTTYIAEGHADIGVHYEEDHGLQFYVAADGEHHHHEEEEEEHEEHDHEEEEDEHDHGDEMHPADVTFLLSGYAVMTVPDDAQYAFLGDAGTTVYFISQQPMEGSPFAGLSTEELDPSLFAEDISLELHEVDGPGDVFLWEVDTFGAVNVLWNSADADEDVLTLPAGIHRHFNIAVSQPGTYALEVHAEGALTEGEEIHTETVLNLQAGGLEGYFGHFERTMPSWIAAETGGWLYTANWPWLWSPELDWIFAWGIGGPNQYYFSAQESGWLWTTPEVFPYYWNFQGSEWKPWYNAL